MCLAPPPPPKSINNGPHTNNNVNGELSDIKYPQCSRSNSNCSVPGRLNNHLFSKHVEPQIELHLFWRS